MKEIDSIREILKILECDDDGNMKEDKLLAVMINLQDAICQWTKKNIEDRLKIIASLHSDKLTGDKRYFLLQKSEDLLVKINAGEAVIRLLRREKIINHNGDKNGD